tara:strand:- start:186 stop:482 length:297 start_codon:yes stop_codon:yes gene_type:complete
MSAEYLMDFVIDQNVRVCRLVFHWLYFNRFLILCKTYFDFFSIFLMRAKDRATSRLTHACDKTREKRAETAGEIFLVAEYFIGYTLTGLRLIASFIIF